MASVYFVTGKLGSGKSLIAVSRIRDALMRGVPVATNLNINLKEMIGRDKRNTRLYRLPDKPTVEDIEILGYANKSYDTSKDGLIVLDECGTWFNSRTWNDKNRQALLDRFLHIRKLGWDVIFIVQNISMVDKQAREGLAEHVVHCKRLDRMQIPFLSTIVWILTLGQLKIPMPKLHIGIVKYGDTINALTVDKWMLWGTDLYSSYDTKQIFQNHYPHGTYSVLPPWYIHGRYTVPYTARNIMRITKILFRKYSRVAMFAVGAAFGAAFWHFTSPEPELIQLVQAQNQMLSSQPDSKLSELLGGFTISRYTALPDAPVTFELSNGAKRLTSYELQSMGFEIEPLSRCEIIIKSGAQNETIHC
ncbi:TPA: zonular occludens toxin domain-containing protein [Vibrio cholerae]|uniref:zonular occludens toxin domain-containing protein n=9 Tax=Gammaproteobacteria TaxID=1236 RepID=UPI00063913E0|nr:zonular occludens toxin domain-containing protein [Vibrio cholerae]KKP22169.1 maturation protein [Vibrio cholerae]OWH58353.1 hypothetical protein CBG31_17765 [Vibrio cholerae O139]OWH69281.1 hypothetical protein CBG29_16680 [Vibrio cholerae O139]HAS4469086.1 hypothetical protein [Vibrio cholerae]HCJ6817574.1 hypothetical protein [Vibrio cholerae]